MVPMRILIFSIVVGLALIGRAERTLVAGDQKDRAVVMMSADADAAAEFTWKWTASGDPNVRKADVPHFNNVSDCKVRDGGRTVLVCASGGGCAAIDVATARVTWQGLATPRRDGPHAIERLPDGRYAVANSTGVDALELIDGSAAPFVPERQRLVRAWDVPGAHGLCWDAKRESLFVIGYTNIFEFAYGSETMSVTLLRSWDYTGQCGDPYGHDFMPDGTGGYFFTNHSGVWRFDPGAGSFAPVFSDRNVKSFTRAAGGADVLTIPRESWWTDRVIVREGGTDRVIGPFPGSRFYKARWCEGK